MSESQLHFDCHPQFLRNPPTVLLLSFNGFLDNLIRKALLERDTVSPYISTSLYLPPALSIDLYSPNHIATRDQIKQVSKVSELLTNLVDSTLESSSIRRTGESKTHQTNIACSYSLGCHFGANFMTMFTRDVALL